MNINTDPAQRSAEQPQGGGFRRSNRLDLAALVALAAGLGVAMSTPTSDQQIANEALAVPETVIDEGRSAAVGILGGLGLVLTVLGNRRRRQTQIKP